jgi:hypothetical protein
MAKTSKDDLTEAKAIAARMLAMPPQPHNPSQKVKPGSKPAKRTSGKGRARVGKGKN